MKCHMVAHIPDPEVFVHNFLQAHDIIFLIGQNKNTLAQGPVKVVFSPSNKIPLYPRFKKGGKGNFLPLF